MSNVEAQASVGPMVAMLQSRNRGRECLELLRKYYRLLLASPGGVAQETTELRSLLFKALQDAKVPRKIGLFFQQTLALLTRGELGFVKVDLAQTYDPVFAAALCPLLVQCGSPSAYKKNLGSIVSWCALTSATPSPSDEQANEAAASVLLMQCAFRAMAVLAREERESLQYAAHIRLFEAQLMRVLGRAAKVSRLKGGGFFKIGASSTQAATLELDGKPTLDLFTALSCSFDYSPDQLLNVQVFCSIRSWLSDVYLKPQTVAEELLTRKLDPTLRDGVVDYCLRVLSQARLPMVEDPANRSTALRNNTRLVANICLNEAIRVLHTLCSLDNSLVPRIFPMVRAAAPVPSLEGLEFLLHHSPASSDCDSLFRTFFSSMPLDDPVLAFNVLAFCVRNKDVLKAKTRVFGLFFPSFLKLLAWHPLSLLPLVSALLPNMVSNQTFVELVHSVLDMPLIAASLEDEDERGFANGSVNNGSSAASEAGTTESEGTFSSMNSSVASVEELMSSSTDPFRAITALLLRSESGVAYNLWEGEAVLVQSFCTSKMASARVLAVARATPVLLGVLCDALLASALADEHLEQLLRVLFGRMNKLLPLPDFQGQIRHVLENKVLAVLHRSPSFVVSLKTLIVGAISSATLNAGELALNLCWSVCEHIRLCPPSAVREYHEALELFTYERLSLARPDARDAVFQSRLMLTLVTCLSKLAAREQHLAPRVILCLSKVAATSAFHQSVYTRARECVLLLKMPAHAAILFGTPNSYSAVAGSSEERYDDFSSFAMLRKCRVVECSSVISL